MAEQVTRETSTIRDMLTEIQCIIILESCYVVWFIMSILGVISNIINIKVFIAMGLKDGVTVSFLALAIFDLTYLIASLSCAITVSIYVWEFKLYARLSTDPFAIVVFNLNVLILSSITNVLTTTFLAVARCMCVARPLQFKNTFTRKRAAMFMSGFAVFAVAIYTPIVANMGMITKYDILTNMSRLSLWMSPKRDAIKNNIWMVTEMLLPVGTQFIIIVCVIIMARSLRAASKFRQTSLIVSTKLSGKSHKERDCQKDDIVDASDSNSSNDKLSGKDLRVVQQVVLISLVYIACNVPRILISIFTMIEPEFTVSRGYNRLYLCANCLRKHFEIVNAAVNLIIYYKYSTKFRSTLGL